MALKNKYFEPKEYYYKVIFICILLFIDILFNCFTQFLDFGSTNAKNLYSMQNYEKDSGNISFALIA
jgi:hypothetical protein